MFLQEPLYLALFIIECIGILVFIIIGGAWAWRDEWSIRRSFLGKIMSSSFMALLGAFGGAILGIFWPLILIIAISNYLVGDKICL
jgi:hypothetical protein